MFSVTGFIAMHRYRGLECLLALAALLRAGEISAQSTEAQRERVRRLVDQLAAFSGARRRVPPAWSRATDTIRMGPLLLLAEPELSGLARAAVTRASTRLQESFPNAVGLLAETGTVFMLYSSEVPTANGTNEHQLMLSHTRKYPNGSQWTATSQNIRGSNEFVGLVLAEQASAQIVEALQLNPAAWLGNSTLSGNQLLKAYLQLATSGRIDAQGCLRGVASDCVQVLQLNQPSILASSRTYNWDEQALVTVRGSLLKFALRVGGPGSAARFRGQEGESAAARLTSAAGMGIDPLIREWRRGLAAASPSVDLPKFASFTPLALITVLILLANARRTVRR
jgi:hypothetical protein